MFEFFKKKPATSLPATPEILGFRLGGCIELNDLKLRLLEGSVSFEKVAKQQIIQAVGKVQLDTHTTILRYYTDDEGFFQVVLEGGMGEEHIRGVQLWFFYETKGISGDREWETVLANGISMARLEHNDKSYTPVWSGVDGISPPVAMTEETATQDGESSTTDQFMMLYEHPINDDLSELALLSGEEQIVDGQPQRCLVISTGIELNSADFEVIS